MAKRLLARPPAAALCSPRAAPSLAHAQALKQLGPSTQQQPAASASSAAAMAPPAPPAGALGSSSSGLGPMSAEQLSSLAAVLALEGVPTDVILQTLGLPATLAEALLPPASAPMSLAGLGGLDGAALLAQALPSPALSSQTGFDLAAAVAARGSLDLRASFDLSSASLPLVPSARTSMDLGSLHQSLAAAAAAMHPSDSRSTLATCDWSNAPSARTSMDVGGLPLLPPASAGFMAPAPALSRLSLDAALALQQRQQMQQTQQLLASQGRLSAAYPTPQQPLASVMHSGFYQPAAAAAPPPPRQPEPQLSMQSVLSSGLYGGGAPAGAPLPPPPARHSIALGEYGSGGGLVPFGDTWTPAPREQQGTLGGYSTALRPSIDRGGLPPLPPRSPNQGERSGGACWAGWRLRLPEPWPLANCSPLPTLPPVPQTPRPATPAQARPMRCWAWPAAGP